MEVRIIFLVFLVDPSYNQPKLSVCASWNLNATTFADNATLGTQPTSVFVDRNNTVYATAFIFNRVLVWSDGNLLPTRNISGSLNQLIQHFCF